MATQFQVAADAEHDGQLAGLHADKSDGDGGHIAGHRAARRNL